jgi:hypothetical protein
VAQFVYPGVTVRFPGVETVFTTAFKGPFTLTPRKAGGITEIVLIDGTDQSKSVLPSHHIDPAAAAKTAQLLDKKAA